MTGSAYLWTVNEKQHSLYLPPSISVTQSPIMDRVSAHRPEWPELPVAAFRCGFRAAVGDGATAVPVRRSPALAPFAAGSQ